MHIMYVYIVYIYIHIYIYIYRFPLDLGGDLVVYKSDLLWKILFPPNASLEEKYLRKIHKPEEHINIVPPEWITFV